jgi:hypothetical protein
MSRLTVMIHGSGRSSLSDELDDVPTALRLLPSAMLVGAGQVPLAP